MNNQLEQVRTPELIAQEIRGYTAMMLNNVIEIGRRMCEVKEMLPHGEFGKWINENTDYSVSTANNFMRLFLEYADEQITLFGAVSNSQTIGKLSYTKALALLSLPSEEREKFIEEANVEEMSTRELKEAISKIKALEEDKQTLEKEVLHLKGSLKEAEEDLDEAEEELEKMRNAVDNPIEAAVTATDPAEVEKAVNEALAKAAKEHASEMDKMMQKLNTSAKEKDKLEKKLLDAKKALSEAESKISSGSASYIAEAERARAEVDRLRREIAMADPVTAEFKGVFEQTSVMVTKLLRLASEASEDNAPRLRAALTGLGKQILGE